VFFKQKDLHIDQLDDNSSREVLAYGDQLMNARIFFKKGLDPETAIPVHNHPHVQTTYVLKGSFKFIIKYPDHDDIQVVKAGDGIYFPAQLFHGCIPLEDDSQLLDSFTPIRVDFLQA
jgi:quercetin dioxygenase-like cupin family protein